MIYGMGIKLYNIRNHVSNNSEFKELEYYVSWVFGYSKTKILLVRIPQV